MTSRYGSHLSNRGTGGGGGLFANYDDRSASRSPSRMNGNTSTFTNRYASTPDNSSYNASPYGGGGGASNGPSFSAYPNSSPSNFNSGGGYRTATPNAKGQYSDATMEAMESQNEEQISSIIGKVGRLKDLTMKIGDEIRDSSKLAESMNDQFSGTTQRLRGTMRRMLRMAERTGVGWRVWLGFFAAVILLFWYVWLF